MSIQAMKLSVLEEIPNPGHIITLRYCQGIEKKNYR